MKGFGTRIHDLRKIKSLSQQDLAKKIGVHFTNLGKYERDEAIPSADTLNKLAKALDVTSDYLLNGTVQDKANNTIKDQELLMQFKKIEKLPNDKKKLLLEFIDSFVIKSNLMQQLTT
jgi:transcriptional regulator with XRE-family HTH domain